MYKPRIIIADMDEKYIAPLQVKFAEEYFNKVNLEIVTERSYFHELFSVPQKADILIVSEDLYSPELQRHNIRHTFIMTEQHGEEQTANLNVDAVRIFKYTSLKVIFNEITGKSSDVLQSPGKPKDCKIILVYSASGGAGKTTLSLGMSLCLTRSYKRVLYINAARLQYFQRMLDNQSPITDSEVYTKLAGANDRIYPEIEHVIRHEGFYYLPPFKASLMSLGLPYSIYKTIVLSAKASKKYDYIIVDADSAFDEDKADFLSIADKVVVVSNQNRTSAYATNLLLGNIDGVDSEKYIFICNDFDKKKENALISPEIRFSVNDYIGHFEHYDQMKCEDFAKDSGIQRISFLIV